MKKLFAVMAAVVAVASPLFAQSLTGTLGTPIATVKLVKTEIIYEKAFRADVLKVETLRKSTLSADERKAFLEGVINDLLFYQMCERDGIKTSDAEVNAYISRVKSQLGTNVTDAQFEAYLAGQGIPIADLRSYYRKQILVQKWLQATKSAEIAAIPPVTSDDVLRTYDLYKSKLIRPDTARIAFIYYPFKDKTDAERTKAAEGIRGLSERLSKGENFDALRLKAADGSYGASRDYSYFERTEVFASQFGKTIFDTVFGLKDGTVSAPVENDAGWWIVRRAEYFPQKQLELSDPYRLGQQGSVQDYIAQLLAQEKQNAFMNKTFSELFADLRSKATVKILGTP